MFAGSLFGLFDSMLTTEQYRIVPNPYRYIYSGFMTCKVWGIKTRVLQWLISRLFMFYTHTVRKGGVANKQHTVQLMAASVNRAIQTKCITRIIIIMGCYIITEKKKKKSERNKKKLALN